MNVSGYDIERAREIIRADRERGLPNDLRFAAIGLLSEVETLRARVAELETGEVRTEWGVRWAGLQPESDTEERVREVAADPDEDCVAVRREVRTGPWIEAS